MKQGRVIRAIGALARINGQRMPLRVSYALFKLQQALQPAFEYQTQRERELIEGFPPSAVDGNKLMFDNPENGRAFNAGLAELAEMESEVVFSPVRIDTDCQIDISMEDVAALDGFVEFTESEKG